MTSKKRLTIKEAKLVKARASGKTLAESYREAYETNASDDTAYVEAYRTLKKPHVASALEVAMSKQGLTDDKLMTVLAGGLDANKPNEYTGEVLPDHGVRHKYLETALKLKGYANAPGTINVNFNQVADDQRKKYGL